jgi:hypothetical protein
VIVKEPRISKKAKIAIVLGVILIIIISASAAIAAKKAAPGTSPFPMQRATNISKVQQISMSLCFTTDSTIKKIRPLSSADLENSTYSYGLLLDYAYGIDGMFVKGGCRGQFQLLPTNQSVFCSSWDLQPEFCRAQGEVFLVTSSDNFARSESENACAAYGAELATVSQLRTALQLKGMWCYGGWTNDSLTNVYNPYILNTTDKAGQTCGNTPEKMHYDYLGGGIDISLPLAEFKGKAPVNCYGVRPLQPKTNQKIVDFSKAKKSMYWN